MRSAGDQPQREAGLGHQDARAPPGLRDLQDLSLILGPSWVKWRLRLERRGPPQTHSPTCRLRWDRWDLGDLLVSEELLDLRDSWDLKEMAATLALLEMLVLREKLECLDYRGNLENLARMETLDPLVQLGGQEREVFLECLVFLDQKATEDFLDSTEPKETLGLQEKRGRMVLLVLWEQLVLLVPQAPEEKEEGMDLLECLDQED